MKSPNYEKPYTDAQLRVILSDAPTRPNAMKHARALGRSTEAIEMIYRHAITPRTKDPNQTFWLQIKRIAKELHWF